jgi:transcription antitermination protein NusB
MTARKQGGGRRTARRTALFLLYQWELTGRPLDSQPTDDIDPFARELAEGVAERRAELDRRIDDVSKGWPSDRLGVLERNILRIGIYELEGDTVPVEVAISEAVVLAKRYASEEAGRLVNGILGQVAREQVS